MSGVAIATRESNGTVSLDEEIIGAFSEGLRGPCLRPGDRNYDEERVIWNGSIDKKPALIVQCSGVADVIDAIKFSRTHDLLVAVRGGGHNVAGNCLCDDGIVIDLSCMNQVRVDPDARRVRAGGGATIGDVDRETLAFGLAVPLGIVSQTGIGGLTLCGGHSWLARKHGFACDNLFSVDLVTAEGEFVKASKSENADLFWAVRGGGGNFGVVTSFEYEAHPIGPEVTFCAPFYSMEDAGEIIRKWRDFIIDSPNDYTANLVVWSIPPHPNFPEELHGRAVVIPSGVHSGPVEDGERFIKPLRELGEPMLDISGPIAYAQVQQAFDPYFGTKRERFNYWKSIYLDVLDDEVIDGIVARALDRPSPWTLFSIRYMGGAMSRMPADANALGGRNAPFMLSIDTSWTEPEKSEEAIAWTRDFWDEMQRVSDGAVYLNFLPQDVDTEALLRASYGDANYEKLVGLKTKYDPTNLFRLNQNIRPTTP